MVRVRVISDPGPIVNWHQTGDSLSYTTILTQCTPHAAMKCSHSTHWWSLIKLQPHLKSDKHLFRAQLLNIGATAEIMEGVCVCVCVCVRACVRACVCVCV